MKVTPVMQIKNNFGAIAHTFTNIADEFETEYIPINTLELVLKENRVKKNRQNKRDEKVSNFIDEYNGLIDSLENLCKQVAEKHPSGKVPIKTIRLFINTIQTNL